MTADLTHDALEQALWARQICDGLAHHSERGSQYLSIRYSVRLAEGGIDAAAGSMGDSYDNALAETVIGLFETEVVRKRGPLKNLDQVEFEAMYYGSVEAPASVAGLA